MREKMPSFSDDLWAIILVLLPLKTITASKSVCKQWKSIVESSFFRKLFLSRHQNSHSSWSLMSMNGPTEVMAHYGCEIWGLQRSLNSYINSFMTSKFLNHPERYRQAMVRGYTDVGFVLIRVVSLFGNVSYYVANPVSQECVETDPPWFESKLYCPVGIATRTEEEGGVLLFDLSPDKLSLLIYSSETGLWTPETVHFPFSLSSHDYHNSISSNGNLHWIAQNSNHDEVVVSIDFYSAGTSYVRVLVTPFPDLGVLKFRRTCTPCQGLVMYMNVIYVTNDDESVEEKFRVWRLKSGEWELVTEITRENGFKFIPFASNPVDSQSVYFVSRYGKRFLSMNLLNGEFVYHNKFERSIDGCIWSPVECAKVRTSIRVRDPTFSSFVLPKWLHRIPN